MKLFFAAVAAVAAVLGSGLTQKKKGGFLTRRPKGTPPNWAVGIAGPLMYGLAAWSGYRAWKRKSIPSLVLWATALFSQNAWGPLLFGKRRSSDALKGLGLNAAAVGKYVTNVAHVDKPAAAMMIPYLAFLGYTGAVNFGLVKKNPGWLS